MRRVILTEHAQFEMARRGLSEDVVRRIALDPEQVVSSSLGRQVRQSRVQESADTRLLLVRVVVVEGKGILTVITAYRTSKIAKYWQAEPEP